MYIHIYIYMYILMRGPPSYRPEVFEDAGGDLLREVSEGIVHSELSADDPRLRTVNLPEFGGGSLELPQFVGYKHEKPMYVCVETRIAMLNICSITILEHALDNRTGALRSRHLCTKSGAQNSRRPGSRQRPGRNRGHFPTDV